MPAIFINPLRGEFVDNGYSACTENVAGYGCQVMTIHFECREKKIISSNMSVGIYAFIQAFL